MHLYLNRVLYLFTRVECLASTMVLETRSSDSVYSTKLQASVTLPSSGTVYQYTAQHYTIRYICSVQACLLLKLKLSVFLVAKVK